MLSDPDHCNTLAHIHNHCGRESKLICIDRCIISLTVFQPVKCYLSIYLSGSINLTSRESTQEFNSSWMREISQADQKTVKWIIFGLILSFKENKRSTWSQWESLIQIQWWYTPSKQQLNPGESYILIEVSYQIQSWCAGRVESWLSAWLTALHDLLYLKRDEKAWYNFTYLQWIISFLYYLLDEFL